MGSVFCARNRAACTSIEALSISLFCSNSNVIEVLLNVLAELITLSPEMMENSRSSFVATDEAMISGLAPGSDALTEIVGES